MSDPEIGYGKESWPSLTALVPVEMHRVGDAVQRFISNPDHPGLNLHPIKAPRSRGLHSFRASDELRVLLHKRGNTYLLLEAGHHDDVYARAQRMAFVDNPHTGFIGVHRRYGDSTIATHRFYPDADDQHSRQPPFIGSDRLWHHCRWGDCGDGVDLTKT